MRGEYSGWGGVYMSQSELPPRARRIRFRPRPTVLGGGTTSACAENTPTPGWAVPPFLNYLRVRGEYQGRPGAGLTERGTTSACAENTAPAIVGDAAPGNYLRVRGEYLMGEIRNQEDLELPPRARRILLGFGMLVSEIGTTSACAENTLASR